MMMKVAMAGSASPSSEGLSSSSYSTVTVTDVTGRPSSLRASRSPRSIVVVTDAANCDAESIDTAARDTLTSNVTIHASGKPRCPAWWFAVGAKLRKNREVLDRFLHTGCAAMAVFMVALLLSVAAALAVIVRATDMVTVLPVVGYTVG